MSGCDAFLRSKYGGRSINGIQNGFDGQTLPCCFNAMNDNGRGAGKGGLGRVSRRQRDGRKDEQIEGKVIGGSGGLCKVFDPAESMIALPGTLKPC